MRNKILLISISFIISLLFLGIVNALGESCEDDYGCGSCEKCVDNICELQIESEDLKNDCGDGNTTCLNSSNYYSFSGYCNGFGSCDTPLLDVGFCEECIIDENGHDTYYQIYGEDLFDECDQFCDGYGACNTFWIDVNLSNPYGFENNSILNTSIYGNTGNNIEFYGHYNSGNPDGISADAYLYIDDELKATTGSFYLAPSDDEYNQFKNTMWEELNLSLGEHNYYIYIQTEDNNLNDTSERRYFTLFNDTTECSNDYDCGLCEECIDNFCEYQSDGDIKNECEQYLYCSVDNSSIWESEGTCRDGECVLNLNDNGGTCEYCLEEVMIQEPYGWDLFNECDLYCDGNGTCYNETIEQISTLNSWYNFFFYNQNVLIILAVILIVCGGVIYYINKS